MKGIKKAILWKVWNFVDGCNWLWFRLERTKRGRRFLSLAWMK